MRSTAQYVSNPYKPDSASRQKRRERLNQKRDKPLSPPSLYLDSCTLELMTLPHNIKPTATFAKHLVIDEKIAVVINGKEEISTKSHWEFTKDKQGKHIEVPVEDIKNIPDYYVDASTRYRYKCHPMNKDVDWNLFWEENRYPFNEALCGQIETWLRIEEIKQYRRERKKERKIFLKKFADKLTEQEKACTTATTTAEVLQAYGREHEKIPDHFRSQMPGMRLMTLPVRIDGMHVIDFEELFQCQLVQNVDEKEDVLTCFKSIYEHKKFQLEWPIKKEIRDLNELSEVTFSAEQKKKKMTELDKKHQDGLAKLEKECTLDWYIKTFHQPWLECNKTDNTEYYNPFTKRPIQNIEVAFELLKEIDNWVDPLQYQIRIVRCCIEQAERKNPTTKSYADILKEKKFPPDKIPESIALARTPGASTPKVATHPVILDEEFVIDFADLEKFWHSQGLVEYVLSYIKDMSWMHYNPFPPNNKIKTIRYCSELKEASDHFMDTLFLQRAFITPTAVRSANYRFLWFATPRDNILETLEIEEDIMQSTTPTKKLM